MLAMQYAIDLPADYDMEIIRRRVRDNGDKTDGFPDLELKAYLIAEKGKYGNTRNQYAPFYLWRGTEGMNAFLLHGPFGNILSSFGWPTVRTWLVIASAVDKSAAPAIARVGVAPIRPYADFERLAAAERQAVEDAAPGVSAVSAYCPRTWELCRFTMAKSEKALPAGEWGDLVYDIHHIS